MAVATQRAAVYADSVVFLGEDPGPGEGGNLYCLTRHFTNAQVKALPTTPLEILPAPGANYTWIILSCVVMLDSTDGLYTNIDAGGYLAVDDAPDFLPNDALLGWTECSTFFGTAGHQLVMLRRQPQTEVAGSGTLANYQAQGWGLRPTVETAFTSRANAAVTLVMENEASGNLTGGHAQNSMLVRTLAMKVPSPTLWETLYPTA